MVQFAIAFSNRNANKVKGHSSLKKGGCHEVYDIEDLVKIGQEMKGLVFLIFFLLIEISSTPVIMLSC